MSEPSCGPVQSADSFVKPLLSKGFAVFGGPGVQKGGRFYLDFTLGELQRIAQLISAAPNKISELAFAEMGHGGKGAKKKG